MGRPTNTDLSECPSPGIRPERMPVENKSDISDKRGMSKNSKAQKWWDSREPADRTCCYCHRRLLRPSGESHQHPANASIDHDIPKCRMGYKQIIGSNIVLSCAACNAAKADMTGDEFMHFLRTGEILPSYISWMAEKIRKQIGRHSVPGMVLRGGYWVEK